LHRFLILKGSIFREVTLQRRKFLSQAGLLFASRLVEPFPGFASSTTSFEHHLPLTDPHYRCVKSYVEDTPVAEYQWASEAAYEAFHDMKYGIRVHWGLYSLAGFAKESWPFLDLTYQQRAHYNQMYKTWNPIGFDADEWTSLFAQSGLRMFAFTTKHHEGFSMFDSRTRVRQRVRWDAVGGPALEDCDLAYSIMETPFKRDVVKELCEAGRKRGLRISLYFSHPDWYDADFRPYADDPVQVPSSAAFDTEWRPPQKGSTRQIWIAPDPTPAQMQRMMARHRAQLEELLTNYGEIHMLSLDQWLGPKVWPQLRETILQLRKLQPNVMLRARGIGNYGDYYTPEGFIPGSKSNTGTPWMVIYPLAAGFSYDPQAAHYKGAAWIVKNIIDTAAKGGSFQVGVGPDGGGKFHPTAVEQLKQAGAWLQVCGEGIYSTRPREDELWREGETIRFTRTKNHRTVHCFALEWPGKTLTLQSVRPSPRSNITMFGYPHPMKWTFDSTVGLKIELPEPLQQESRRPNEYAWGWTIQIA
jgi:alpha-L-fucosidase